jgi:hypothetical protein
MLGCCQAVPIGGFGCILQASRKGFVGFTPTNEYQDRSKQYRTKVSLFEMFGGVNGNTGQTETIYEWRRVTTSVNSSGRLGDPVEEKSSGWDAAQSKYFWSPSHLEDSVTNLRFVEKAFGDAGPGYAAFGELTRLTITVADHLPDLREICIAAILASPVSTIDGFSIKIQPPSGTYFPNFAQDADPAGNYSFLRPGWSLSLPAFVIGEVAGYDVEQTFNGGRVVYAAAQFGKLVKFHTQISGASISGTSSQYECIGQITPSTPIPVIPEIYNQSDAAMNGVVTFYASQSDSAC